MNWFDHIWSGLVGPHIVALAITYLMITLVQRLARRRRLYELWWWTGFSSAALTYAALTVAICAVAWDGKHVFSVIPFVAIFSLNVLDLRRVEREISVRRVWDAWRVATPTYKTSYEDPEDPDTLVGDSTTVNRYGYESADEERYERGK